MMDGQTRFGLIFQPAIPQFNAKLLTVDVNDPSFWPPQGRGVGFVYDFAGDTRFSGDARVFVGEEPAESNEEANLKQMAHSLPLASVTSIEGRSVTLLQSDGVGRTLWVWENVEYTIAGPAVPPAVVMDLTRQFISQG
ncbi:MAG: hypothetical protein ACXVQ1_01725 [Actinomycetota bacterium]